MTINFPNHGEYHIGDLTLDCVSLGRNGNIHTAGIDVDERTCTVCLSPMRVNGEIGRCNIEVPKDKEFLLEFAAEIKRIAETL